MIYTVGYRGFTIWRDDPAKPFRLSRTTATDLETLERKAVPHFTAWSFSKAREEADYLRRAS